MSFFIFKQKTAYEMRISDWSSDVCSSDLLRPDRPEQPSPGLRHACRGLFRLRLRQRLAGPSATPAGFRPCRRYLGADGRLSRPYGAVRAHAQRRQGRSEEHTSELPSLMRSSYAVLCLKNKTTQTKT